MSENIRRPSRPLAAINATASRSGSIKSIATDQIGSHRSAPVKPPTLSSGLSIMPMATDWPRVETKR